MIILNSTVYISLFQTESRVWLNAYEIRCHEIPVNLYRSYSVCLTFLVFAVRYLLKKQADVLLKNEAGDLPIHLACQYAQQGHKYGKLLMENYLY